MIGVQSTQVQERVGWEEGEQHQPMFKLNSEHCEGPSVGEIYGCERDVGNLGCEGVESSGL
jgi:hypothetical protein